jgi:CheY-like chemotaxis protein
MSDSSDFPWNDFHILVADDEPDMREIFAAWFRNLGCAVTEVSDGQAALEAASRQQFDAIVSDVRMPRVNGVQMVNELHASGTYTPVVIFVSGFVDLPLSDAFDLGVEAVLTKPCERKELIRAVQRSLLRRDLIFSLPGVQDSLALPEPANYLRESFSGSLSDSHVALGRGGMSLNTDHRPSGIPVGFALSFSWGVPTILEGWGMPRWLEAPAGVPRMGIEFLHLIEPSRAQFGEWLKADSPVSFIPKSPARGSLGSVARGG